MKNRLLKALKSLNQVQKVFCSTTLPDSQIFFCGPFLEIEGYEDVSGDLLQQFYVGDRNRPRLFLERFLRHPRRVLLLNVASVDL